MTPGPERLVIIGSGMAAARLAEQVLARRGDRAFEIVMFGEEPGGTYNRVLLSGVLAGSHAGPDIVTNPLEWFAAQGITLHAGVRIERIDPDARAVIDAHGACHAYDRLVLATGSRPVVPDIEALTDAAGRLCPGAFVFRTVDDCARIAAAAAVARHAVVLGGGLLGLEAARGLVSYGIAVTVVHRGPHLMDAQLDAPAGTLLQRRFEADGVRVLTGRHTRRVTRGDAFEGLQFSDGTAVTGDLLVIATGVRANVELAVAAGLLTRKGVVVGNDLRSASADAIYAIGDCAEHDGRLYGLIAPAWEQADVLADILTQRRPEARYRGSRIATKLKVAGLDLAVMGVRDASDADEVITYSEPRRGIYSKVVVRDERIAGAVLLGAPDAVPAITQRFLDGALVPERRCELLFPPLGDGPATAVAGLPDSARICDCNGVTKATIVEAVLEGARSLPAVCARTRAGTGCGSCRSEVQRLVDDVCRSLDGAPSSRGDHHAPA